ncbi:MAG: hypothetical protein CBD29_00520 [Synechococcus sp. TMED169]|jgi:hypothetical protein|nr:MAG: hypothetical protein CBD29_00520 [Synechococcus sp. TMED169]
MPDFVARMRAITVAALASVPVSFASAPALAIPEEAALKKLAVVPVFLLTSEKGIPLPIPNGDNLILPMFLQKERANQELATFEKANPNTKAKVSAIPMNTANERVNQMNIKLKETGKQIVTPVVGSKADMDQAVAILEKQGVSKADIQKGLSIPVFFHKPFLTIKTPEGSRGVFFMTYKDATNAAGKVQGAKPEIMAVDLTNALAQIVDEKEDRFVFYPTTAFFALMKDQGAPNP